MARKSWSARGSPLLRRTSSSAAPAAATDVVRQCLLQPPQPAGLDVARPGAPESRQIRRARVTHGLEPWEDLIAVWQWSKMAGLVSATPSSMIFTGCDIRIAEPRLRLTIPYESFGAYSFRSEYTPGGVHVGPDVFELAIDGPTPWRSPNCYQDAELMAEALTRIRAILAAGPA